MIQIRDKKKCAGCNACAAVCPKQCIHMAPDDEGFLYPTVDETQCINCDLCTNTCSVLKSFANHPQTTPAAYAAINRDEQIRQNSSSGGVFTLLAEYALDCGGIVFGAAFNKRFEVEHIAISRKDQLYRLRGSKYVQSRIGDSYLKAKQFLDVGRTVLFTGTPCQIGGLKAYLNQEYEKLVCQDIVCHGVPSPAVWKRYLEYREKESVSKTRSVCFRKKKYGWKAYSVSFEFSNNTEYVQPLSEDLYMQAFLSDYCLRPSCYACSFKSLARQSDFTLADFWGIQDILPEMDDDKGTSLIFVHTKKAQTILGSIESQLILQDVVPETAIRKNTTMLQSAKYPPKRDAFMQDIQVQPFAQVISKYCGLSLRKIAGKLKKELKKHLIKNIDKRFGCKSVGAAGKGTRLRRP